MAFPFYDTPFALQVRIKMKKAVLVFSGGQDSTTCLIHLLSQYTEVHAITFDYGQRHRLEIDVATRIARKLGVEHHILDCSLLNQLAPSALTRDSMQVNGAFDENGRPNTFVPGRNIIFLSLAAIYAYQIQASDIVTGICKEDHLAYPDCRAEFAQALNTALNLGIDKEFHLRTPLIQLSKAETWALAERHGQLDLVLNETLTCYNGIVGAGCGECQACLLRRRGLDSYLSNPASFQEQLLEKIQ